jgi:hypothetical protein
MNTKNKTLKMLRSSLISAEKAQGGIVDVFNNHDLQEEIDDIVENANLKLIESIEAIQEAINLIKSP